MFWGGGDVSFEPCQANPCRARAARKYLFFYFIFFTSNSPERRLPIPWTIRRALPSVRVNEMRAKQESYNSNKLEETSLPDMVIRKKTSVLLLLLPLSFKLDETGGATYLLLTVYYPTLDNSPLGRIVNKNTCHFRPLACVAQELNMKHQADWYSCLLPKIQHSKKGGGECPDFQLFS